MPKMPNWERTLILETSGNVGQVALACGETVLATGQLNRERRRASDLAVVCQELLGRHGWRARDLTVVVVGMGPGSYTALRVGMASAKMLAYAAGCDFVGVETFAAYASQVDEASVTVIADALQGEVYCRSYARDSESLIPTSPLEIRKQAELVQFLHAGTVVTGPGTQLLNGDSWKFAATEARLLQPGSLLAVARREAWAITRDVWNAEPFYLRGSSAEEKKRRENSST